MARGAPVAIGSGPQPMRSRAGRTEATSSASSSIWAASTPHTSAARATGHARATARYSSTALGVVSAERLVHRAPLSSTRATDGVGEHDVGARTHGEVQIGAAGPRRSDADR